MPELPEVETVVRDLNKVLPGLKIRDVWCDFPKMIKCPSFRNFKKELVGRKILKVKRRGKNILIGLSENKTLLIHQKMTGHMLYGKYQKAKSKKRNYGTWTATEKGPLKDDPQNRFLHLVIGLSNGRQLALSDLRKFAKVLVCPTDKLGELKDLKDLGPEPLEKSFTFDKFKKALEKKKGKIHQVLMNQKIIAGIGNIYSSEILWQAGIHPLKEADKLNREELSKIYQAIRKILTKALKLGGTSISDFRKPSGEKGFYAEIRKVYRREGQKCGRCRAIIKRIKLAGRSAHFCPICQR